MKKIILTLVCLTAAISATFAKQPEIKSQWNGMKVAFLGDSITDSNQIAEGVHIYWQYLEEILGITPYVYGISGHESKHIIGQAERMENDHGQDVDAIFVFIGANDYNQSVPIGCWWTEDVQLVNYNGMEGTARRHRNFVFSEDTFKGRLNKVTLYLKSHYPDKQIIFLTPIHRGYSKFSENNVQPNESYANGIGEYTDAYADAVNELADVWGVPVIDLNSICGLNPMVEEQVKYFRKKDTDRLHPNSDGHRRMAYAIAYQLLGYPARF